jgi:hypothetical protein
MLPYECWQSDVTHWHFADGTEVDICKLPRRPLACCRGEPGHGHGQRRQSVGRLPAGGFTLAVPAALLEDDDSEE